MKKSSKKSSKKNERMVVPINLGVGFPMQLAMTHKYVDEFTLTSALGVMANYRFRANGMYDPNHTAAGHQPSYFDVLTGLYDHWEVVSSEVNLTFIPTTNPATPTAIGVALNDDTTTIPTSFVAYEESSHVKVRYLTFEPGGVVKMNLTYSANKYFPNYTLGNRGLWGDAAADPAEEVIFNVFLQAVDRLSSAACFCIAKITYKVVWFELKDLVLS
jgi:hypothetical protein